MYPRYIFQFSGSSSESHVYQCDDQYALEVDDFPLHTLDSSLVGTILEHDSDYVPMSIPRLDTEIAEIDCEPLNLTQFFV